MTPAARGEDCAPVASQREARRVRGTARPSYLYPAPLLSLWRRPSQDLQGELGGLRAP